MHIDWFIFFSQIVNFLILAYLLKRFLYGRIITAIDERENAIVARFDEAERLKNEARQAAEAYDKKYRSLQERSEEMLNQAQKVAEARRTELMDEARQEVEQIRQGWIETIEREKISFLQDLRRRAGSQIYAIARTALSELADAELERKIADVFLTRLRNLDGTEGQAIRESMGKTGSEITIQSAFEIPPDIRQRISETLKPYLTDGAGIGYETLGDVISGIEMRVAGYKIAWSLNEYLETLEESFSQALQMEAMKKGR
jgi:F-type H+-transporting ATPase subunit b